MKINIIDKPEIIMSNPESKHNYFAWPSAVRLQNGKIAVSASGFRLGHVCPFGKAVIMFTEDEGNTYTLPSPVIDTVLDDRDAGLCTFGKSGLILTSFNNTIEFQRSINLKRTDDAAAGYVSSYLDTIKSYEENKALGATFRISNDYGVSFGKVFKSPVTSPHGPLELKDGTILWAGRVFSNNDSFSNGKNRIEVYVIKEDGTMHFRGKIANVFVDETELNSCEPNVIELNDGTLLCHIRVEPTFTIYQSVSTDKGYTWSKPQKILPDKGGAPSHLFRHSSGVLISAYGYRQKPYGIKIMYSLDEGKTWNINNDLYVNNVSADLGYPSTVELKDRTLLTVFYAHEKPNTPAVIMQQRWSMEL